MQGNIEKLILTDRLLGEALNAMRPQIAGADSSLGSKLDDIRQDYQLMQDYMMKGYKDPKIEEVYDKLLRSAYRLSCSIKLAGKVSASRTYASAKARSASFDMQKDVVTGELERFVQDVAFSTLKPEAERKDFLRDIYKSHYEYMMKLFGAILVSDQWSDGMAEFMTGLLLSPTVDVVDSLLVVSAVSISVMNVFDVNKWTTLARVYECSADQRLRQRALVGWVLSMPSDDMSLFKEIDETVARLMSDATVRSEIVELQIQIYYCSNADADTARIQNEIMPDLIKNNQIRITKSGIVENENDPAEDILDPGAADRKMENLEKAVESMVDMQKAGSDIYFGGFSQMKRFPFFYELSNWFCPFYREHPMLDSLDETLRGSKFMEMVFGNGPFCDSDKYSFAFAMSSVISRIPDNMREMLDNSGTMSIPGSGDIDVHSPAYVRRMYLQDLYRFFRLYDGRADFNNPFVDGKDGRGIIFITNPLIAGHLSIDDVVETDKFLYKHGFYLSVIALAENIIRTDDIRHYSVVAMSNMRVGDYYMASTLFNIILAQDAENEQALKGLAHVAFASYEFGNAADYYQQLLSLHPDNTHYALNRAISQISDRKVDEGMATLFKLDYEQPGNKNVKRGLGWGYLLQGKAEDADRVYTELMALGDSSPSDKLNAGYAKWFLSHVGEAVSLFREYVSSIGKKDGKQVLCDEFRDENLLLESYGITPTEINIMVDLV